ncbi:pentatricopeptide repeat-containing protein At5g50990 [Salvia hispanica]|uniref:pentatricopeptide repeat-containing protein At5g50990 n=1 Tax=Salvia hispanica TaxID=49212 RepID=UPI0020098C89|nr:pentatricopeptide repeat-containing protein At5g50990 [Salvia hispanica]XP_047942218.1 pentatricopeptide repeat-containing protein At5g50990 [Salvia hispanica]XP_047942219.1 pentatricopeptide repeat-containing protein At5g50990 [Salvia hispanica]
MEVVRRSHSLMRPFHRGYAAIFSPNSYSTAASPQTLYPSTDDQTLFCILESCKLPSSIRTAATVHCKILKQGYEMCPSILSSLMKAYAACDKPKHAHRLITEICSRSSNVNSANLLIDSFVKNGEIDTAKKVFDVLPTRDVVAWNLIIGGYIRSGLFVEAVGMFEEMLVANIDPDGYTFASVLTACSKLGALNHGKYVHGLMRERRIELNYILSSALVDLYSRCGRIETAKSIFDTADKTDVSIWNSMINGLAMHGLAADAISVFSAMKGENITPDPVTFIGIITACSHCGLVQQGRKYFDMMKKDFSIQPQLEHYGAMVDLFGRAGLLEEANTIISEMPVEPDVVIWRTLLSACRTHKNSALAEFAVGKMKHLSSGDYVLLSNIYCSAKEWDNAETVRYSMNKKRVHKSVGKSWVELHGAIHYFKAGDRSHPDTEPIYRVLEALSHRSRMEGYVPAPDLVLMDISEEEKEENLNYHSEKLALAFSILKSSPGTEISISKNLRTCLDCHCWIKIVSKVLHRVITVRDRIRFHRFEMGSCSCGDYW